MNAVRIIRMHFECCTSAVRLLPKYHPKSSWKVPRMLYKFTSNAVRMLPEWPPNIVRVSLNSNRMQLEYLECTSNDSDGIRSAFQLNSFNIEIDSGSNQGAFEVHYGSFEAHSGHSGRIWSNLAVLILPRMQSECLECYWNAIRIFRMQSEYS